MQVNRLSLGLQEALKRASNFNTARSETLFDKEKFGVGEDGEINFGNLTIEDLNITEDQISNLLESFSDEVINVFSTGMPDLFGKNPMNPQENQTPQSPQTNPNPVFTA